MFSVIFIQIVKIMKQTLFIGALLLLLIWQDVLCVRVQLYGQPNYRDFLKEIEVHGNAENECIKVNLISIPPVSIRSLKTDKCIIAYYYNQNCDSHPLYFFGLAPLDEALEGSYRFETNTPDFQRPDPVSFPGFENLQPILSFSVCSRKMGGGPEVDVDFYPQQGHFGIISAQYRDVCGCRNLYKSAVGGRSKQISLDNHGNSIDVFEGEHCSGQMKTLPAGNTKESRFLMSGDEKRRFDVKSFRPSSYPGCVKLTATIYKIVFKNGTEEMMKDLVTENVKLTADVVIRSNGTSSVNQEHLIDEKVTSTLEIFQPVGLRNMEAIHLEGNYETVVEGVTPLVSNEQFKLKIGESFNFRMEDGSAKSSNLTIKYDENVMAGQTINVPACTECTVQSFMEKVKNFPIRYTAYCRVHGYSGRNRMSAEEIEEFFEGDGDANYLGEVDRNIAEVMVKGVMYAEFGLKAFINVDCTPVPLCKISSQSGVQISATSPQVTTSGHPGFEPSVAGAPQVITPNRPTFEFPAAGSQYPAPNRPDIEGLQNGPQVIAPSLLGFESAAVSPQVTAPIQSNFEVAAAGSQIAAPSRPATSGGSDRPNFPSAAIGQGRPNSSNAGSIWGPGSHLFGGRPKPFNVGKELVTGESHE